MLLRDILKFSFDALRERKLRAALTILGIAIGPAAIVALIGATEGLSHSVSAQFDKMGVTTIQVMPVGRGFTFTDVEVNTIRNIKGVKEILPYYRVNSILQYGGTNIQAAVVSINLEKLSILFPDITIIEGSMPQSSDMTAALIGYRLAKPPDTETPPISLYQVITASIQSGSTLQGIGGSALQAASLQQQSRTTSRSLLVKGVLSEFGQGLFINPDDTVFVPLESGRLLTGRNQYTGAYVIASSREVVNDVTAAISEIFGNNVRVMTVSSILSTIQNITGTMSTILASIASISVVVAFMGIMTTSFTSVYERTREIGVAKAVGYTNTAILLFFLSEAVLTGFIGGVIGSLSGGIISNFVISLFGGRIGFGAGPIMAGGARAQTQASTLQIVPIITPQLILIAILMATVVGALAGLLPAWRASRLTPVECLRHE
ncbi:MAG: ABC transporter permease [Nitrososphaerales archaeon]